jgi:hypothetical protein
MCLAACGLPCHPAQEQDFEATKRTAEAGDAEAQFDLGDVCRRPGHRAGLCRSPEWEHFDGVLR